MTDEKWEQLVEVAKKNFRGASLRTEDLIIETGDGLVKSGIQDILEFENDSGHFRVIRENKPVVLEKKELYSHRAGQGAQTQYKFSETEFSHKIRIYKERDFDDWEEVTLDKLGL